MIYKRSRIANQKFINKEREVIAGEKKLIYGNRSINQAM
jgi:hypothetical protein